MLVTSSAIRNRQSRTAGRARTTHSGGATRRDARRTDALSPRHRGGRHARQDHDDQPDRQRAGRGRTRSDLRHRRSAHCGRRQRAPRHRRIPGGRSRRIGRLVPDAVADHRRSSPTSMPITWRTTTAISSASRRRSRISCIACRSTASPCSASTTRKCAKLAALTPRRTLTYGIDADADIRATECSPAAVRTCTSTCICRTPTPRRDHAESAGSAQRARMHWPRARWAGNSACRPRPCRPPAAVRGRRSAVLSCAVTSLSRRARALLVDDYGHHPSELAAVFEAARGGWPERSPRGRVPAASLLAHARPARRLRAGARRRRRAGAHRSLSGRRSADRERRRARTGARRARARQGRSGAGRASIANCEPRCRHCSRTATCCCCSVPAISARPASELAAPPDLREARHMSAGITDPRLFGRVAVALGGTSAEREVSLDSGRNVLEALRARGIDAHPVDGIPALLDALRAGHYARVFNILHGRGGEDGMLQGALDASACPTPAAACSARHCPWTRSAPSRSGRRSACRRRATSHSVPATTSHAAIAIGYPAIVKPSHEGSSVGITRVFSDSDLPAAIELATRYDGELLIEQLIEGDELTVGDPRRHRPCRPSASCRRASSTTITQSTSPRTPNTCVPDSTADAEAEIRALALAAFTAVGC